MASQAVVSAAGCAGEGVVCVASALPSVPSWGMPDSTPPGVMSHSSDHWQLAVLEVNGDTSEAPQIGFCLVFWVLLRCCTTSCLDNPAACHFLGRGLEEPCAGGFGAESIHKCLIHSLTCQKHASIFLLHPHQSSVVFLSSISCPL